MAAAHSFTAPQPPVASPRPQARNRVIPFPWFRPRETGTAPVLAPFFDRLTHLGTEVAGEGQRVLASSRSIARQSKGHSDELEDSLHVIEEIRAVAQSGVETCRVSNEKMATARQLVAQTHTLCAQRSVMIEGLLESVTRSHTAFGGLDENLRDVERFLTVIQEIGSQTNLLALNASIEAARAGVHGQGFLVVAREMRLLADRTNEATEQIRQITERIQSSTGTAAAMLGASLKASAATCEQGTRVVSTVVSAQEPMREAEANAQRMAADAARQLQALTRLEKHWRAMRDSALNCTFEADASAEMSMSTIGLANRLFDDLAQLGEALEQGEPGSWSQRVATLGREARQCTAAAGLHRLDELRPRLQSAMQELKGECSRRGLPARRGRIADKNGLPELLFGGRPVNNCTEQVDLVSRRAGLTATLFVLASQPDGTQAFFRVATSVKRGDGARAVGTSLNPRGSVATQLLAKKPAYGFVFILGTPHVAVYEPILDTAGDVLGAWYVGLALDEGRG